MSRPDWLEVGTDLIDEEGEQWMIREYAGDSVWVQHPSRGVHRLLTTDLVAWVESGRWRVSA